MWSDAVQRHDRRLSDRARMLIDNAVQHETNDTTEGTTQMTNPTKAANRAAEKEHFSDLVAEYQSKYPRLTRAQAVAAVAVRHPAAHARYLRACNPSAAWGDQ